MRGKRSAERAVNNEIFSLTPKKIEIFEFKIIEKLSADTFSFFIHCSAGTYVRSLARDLSKILGTVATATEIIRLASGNFLIENAKTIDEIREIRKVL